MSPASAGPRGQPSAPPEPGRTTPPPEPGCTALPSAIASPAAARGRRWTAPAATYAPAGAAAATMTALGLWGLERQSSMGNDEVVTRWAALLSLRRLAHLLRHVDAVHGLYYLLMHGWMAVGASPAVMRVPSVISMTAAVAMTVIIGRRLTGSAWAGLFAGLVMALTPAISFYAQTARSYAMVMACVLGSTLALLQAMRAEAAGQPGARVVRRWACYGGLVALGGYLNEMSLLVLAAHAVTVLLAVGRRRAAAHWAAAAAGSVVLVAPLLVISSFQVSAIGWIPRPGPWQLKVLFHDYFGPVTPVAVALFGCAVAAALPPGRWWRARPGRAVGQAGPESGRPWWRAGGICLPSVAAPLLVLPGSLLLLESLLARPMYVDRYVLYGEAGAALLAGAGVHRIGRWLAGWPARWPGGAAARRTLVWAPGAVLCLCALLLQLGPQQRARTPASRLFDFGGPARYVAASARPGDGVLFLSSFFRKARLGYPGDFRNVSDFAMAVSPARAGAFNGRDKPFPVIRALMLARRRIWVVGRSPFAHLLGPPGQESEVLRRRFALVAERRFRGIVVTLWQRR